MFQTHEQPWSKWKVIRTSQTFQDPKAADGVGCKLGTLSNDDDGGGSENITKKMNLRPFKLYRINLEPPNSSNKEVFHY